MSDTHEARLLLAILRRRWPEAEEIAAAHPLDPGTLVELARRCDVHPSVHAALEESGRFDLVGDAARERLEGMRHKCRADNLLLLARLEQALDLLLEAGIVPVALKGIDFIHRYGVRFDQRTMDDVDLLVAPDRLESCLAVLEKAGWVGPTENEKTHWLRSSYELPLQSPGPVPVSFEIHWGLGQTCRYRISASEVIERASPLEVAGRRILGLDRHDAAAHLLLHHLQHYFDRRLKWALDLGRIVSEPDFEWAVVARRLDEWGGRAAGSISLVHLAKVVPEAAPERARRVLRVEWWRRALTAPLRSRHPLDLFRATRRRSVQLWLAAAFIERPSALPAWLLYRARRDGMEEAGPLGRRGF